MTKEELKDWNELYQFVKSKVMNYDEKQSLSKNMILRLKGLPNGKFMANNNTHNNADYSFKVILNTFKFCMPEIQRVIETKSFKDEMQKFNYILAIINNKINDIYLRMKRAEKYNQEIENIDMSIALNSDNYNSYTGDEEKTDLSKNKYADLWFSK
ncbi:MAG: hypothetical protein NC548_43570 [Lachnospiraceae bacterium]|nr:hypothetical protein [Lachnospiraceae bacterium]